MARRTQWKHGAVPRAPAKPPHHLRECNRGVPLLRLETAEDRARRCMETGETPWTETMLYPR